MVEALLRPRSRVTTDTLSYARMPETLEKEDLELPPLDGATEEESSIEREDDVAIRDEENPYDDATGDDADFSEGVSDDDEESALGDDAAGVGEIEDQLPPELQSESMLGEEDAPGVAGEDFGLIETTVAVRDGGEEGFDTPEPELRAEDLPPLDGAGDDDEMSVEEATDLSPAELRWDDRVLERVITKPIGHVVRIRLRAGVVVTLEDGKVLRSDDGGETFIVADHDHEDDEALISRGRGRALLRDGVGILRAIDDGPLTLVESTEAATAFTLLDDGSVIVAMDQPDKTRLVRIAVDGTATVVAEEDSSIEALAADPRTGVVWAGGAFGLVAYR
jgi:hypothetical protein